VHLLRPTDSVWAGPAPTLTATAATRLVYAGKTVSTVTVQVAVPEGADWTLEGRVSADPADLAPTQGAPLWWEPAPGKTSRTASFTHYDGHWVSGGESSTATPVEPGQKFFVRLWPSTGDGAIAPPPLSATVRVPKVSSAVTLSTKATVLYARNTVFSGTVTVPGADGRIPAGGAVPVVLQSRPHGGAWTTLANLTADADGRFHHERRVYANREYRVLYAGTDAVAGATSPIRAVGVPYDLSATAGLLHRLPDGKWNFSIYGWVRPRPPSGTVTLQRWVVRDGRGRWVTVARPHVTAGGSYLVDIAPGRPPVGTVLRYRVRISGGDLEPHDVVVEKVIQRKLA
jgi:hypothetical protein